MSARPGGGYETRDTNFRAVVISGVVLSVFVAGAAIVAHWIDRRWGRPVAVGDRPMSPLAQMHRVPPAPNLQVNDAVDMVRMREETQGILTTYGWVDPAAGIVRIPIQRAMDLIAERGLPSRKAERERESKP
ncbi:MAG TPA: hypothetical protein VMU17_06845 [Elusimicrobiota bacterium]|nr:hypothetical protein [Elusimicrobiota bacterium]